MPNLTLEFCKLRLPLKLIQLWKQFSARKGVRTSSHARSSPLYISDKKTFYVFTKITQYSSNKENLNSAGFVFLFIKIFKSSLRKWGGHLSSSYPRKVLIKLKINVELCVAAATLVWHSLSWHSILQCRVELCFQNSLIGNG
jgi:hypothetical protein